MPRSRRHFLQSLGAGALVAGAPAWAFARTFDPTREPAPPVRDPKYREWSTVALSEAKRLGCSYSDIRFTRNRAVDWRAQRANPSRRRWIRWWRRDRDVRVRRPRDSQRRVGVREQPAGHA